MDKMIPQHKNMAMGDGGWPGNGSGITPLPGTGATRSMNREKEGVGLSEDMRAVQGNVPMGAGRMGASANPDHGPHGHKKIYES